MTGFEPSRPFGLHEIDPREGGYPLTPHLKGAAPQRRAVRIAEVRQVSPHVWAYYSDQGQVVMRAWHATPHVLIYLKGAEGREEIGRRGINPTRRWKLVARAIWDRIKPSWGEVIGFLAGGSAYMLTADVWRRRIGAGITLAGLLGEEGSFAREFAKGAGFGAAAAAVWQWRRTAQDVVSFALKAIDDPAGTFIGPRSIGAAIGAIAGGLYGGRLGAALGGGIGWYGGQALQQWPAMQWGFTPTPFLISPGGAFPGFSAPPGTIWRN